LTAVVVLSSVAILLRVHSIEGQVDEMAKARDLTAAATQLEVNTLAHALDVRAYRETGRPQAREAAVNEAAEVERHLKEYERLAGTDRERDLAARFAPLWQEFKQVGQALLYAEDGQPKREESERFYDLSIAIEKLLDDEIQPAAVSTYDARRDAALEDVRTIVGFALILLVVGGVIAVVTSAIVGRAVVSGERVIAEQGERLRTTLASIGDAVITTGTACPFSIAGVKRHCLTASTAA